MRHPAAHRPASGIELDLVHVAPTPILARLERPHDRVPGLTKMRGRVLVWGAVAAAHMPAGHAEPQVHPACADPEAILTPVRASRDFVDLIEMFASSHTEAAYDEAVDRTQSV